ncbi:MAG TPA: hypothetical protein VJ302_30195 [Blastocatellia bacterium]|nr:hypothetical protein [Blastocatellia bacterium]
MKKRELRAKLAELQKTMAAKEDAEKKAAAAAPSKKGNPLRHILFWLFLISAGATIYYIWTLIKAQHAVSNVQ